MSIGNLSGLFDGFGGFKEDIVTVGAMAAGGIGANLAFNYAADTVLPKLTFIPEKVQPYVRPALAIAGSAAVLGYGMRYARSPVLRNAMTGAVAGLAIVGVNALVNQARANLLPGSAGVAGLGETDMFDKYLSGATVSVEQQLNGASVTVEDITPARQQLHGLDEVSSFLA